MGQSVFAFTLKNKAGETDSWHIDLKKDGVVNKGLGDKPTGTSFSYLYSFSGAIDPAIWLCSMELENLKGEHRANEAVIVTLALSDEDFGKLVAGKANAQRLFMSGKLKVKGDVMKATKMEPILKRAQTKAKL